MLKVIRILLPGLPLLLLLLISSCKKKDQVDMDPSLKLSFSEDTVFFDTVFTTLGSVTQRLLVYNHNDSKIRISSVTLAGGTTSPYKLNIDGKPETNVTDIEIPAHDSLYIFVKVTVDPNDQNFPFVVSDSILFITNGNLQDVNLVAWGQNANFYRDVSLNGTNLFDSLRPHVIYGYLRIDTLGLLTINPGARVYFHKNASLSVSHAATLRVEGTTDHPVIFAGDRLDPYYRDLPGQWEGISLERGSSDNLISNAVIKNGVFGIIVDSLPVKSTPVLTIDNTIIQNVLSSGIYAYSTKIVSTNCVIGNCGGTALSLVKGGDYNFKHLTIGNYWSVSVRLSPSLYISNYTYDDMGNTIPNDLVNAYFGNCIIYGTSAEEYSADSVPAQFNYMFDHCLLKTTQSVTNPAHFSSSFANEDPKFIDPVKYNYAIDTLSPAIGKGTPLGITYDIKGVIRGNPPDLGAYQFVP